jgi:N-acetylmuramoyl-L-alanine amidase
MSRAARPLHRFGFRQWLAGALFASFLIALGFFSLAQDRLDISYERRHDSFFLAEELRQSSDDLSRFARSYVTTGEARYRLYYQQVLDIRNGSAPRPPDYDNVYWDLVGTSAERWQMVFGGNLGVLQPIGEGDLDAPSAPSWRARPPQESQLARGPMPSAEGLPEVPRGRYRVVIDPGHGGPDPGAVGIRGLRETDVVLDVSLQVAQLLQAKGVEVLLTRTSEVDVDLPPRVALANNNRADLFLSIHANALSLSRPDVNGIETFYFQDGRSRRLAEAVQTQMLRVSPGSPDRGARPGRYFVIRRTVMPSALAEMGFVTGELDSPRLADPAFRQRMAVAIATGLLNYLVANP